MKSTRIPEYPYNFKTVAYTSASQAASTIVWTCNKKLFMRVIPPDDFLEWKNLHVDFSISFRQSSGAFPTSIPLSEMVLESVGVIQELPFPITKQTGKRVELNRQAADVFSSIEVSMDLSGMIDPTGANWVEMVFPDYFIDLQSWGFIELFKLDTLFTTEGIR